MTGAGWKNRGVTFWVRLALEGVKLAERQIQLGGSHREGIWGKSPSSDGRSRIFCTGLAESGAPGILAGKRTVPVGMGPLLCWESHQSNEIRTHGLGHGGWQGWALTSCGRWGWGLLSSSCAVPSHSGPGCFSVAPFLAQLLGPRKHLSECDTWCA